MHILIVYAHPEPKSFNAALKEAAVETLAQAGHEVRVSDLYAQGFKARIDIGDFLKPANPEQLNILAEGANALATGTFLEEIKKEQEKVVWADLVIFQFPLWWFSMPSIMKGWVDRVFTLGFAFDIANGRLYENGLFKGKKAMLSLTTGGPEIGYTPNGRAGDILAVLWPIHSGALRFVGFDVLPPFVAYSVLTASDDERHQQLDAYRKRLRAIESDEPLFFHAGADYDDTGMRLRPGVKAKTPVQHNE